MTCCLNLVLSSSGILAASSNANAVYVGYSVFNQNTYNLGYSLTYNIKFNELNLHRSKALGLSSGVYGHTRLRFFSTYTRLPPFNSFKSSKLMGY